VRFIAPRFPPHRDAGASIWRRLAPLRPCRCGCTPFLQRRTRTVARKEAQAIEPRLAGKGSPNTGHRASASWQRQPKRRCGSSPTAPLLKERLMPGAGGAPPRAIPEGTAAI
jgi:hypothetical protein